MRLILRVVVITKKIFLGVSLISIMVVGFLSFYILNSMLMMLQTSQGKNVENIFRSGFSRFAAVMKFQNKFFNSRLKKLIKVF